MERGSGSCQRSMIDIFEMEESQRGFYCHTWTCRRLHDGRGLICLKINIHVGRLHKNPGLYVIINNPEYTYCIIAVVCSMYQRFSWQQNNTLPTSFETTEAKQHLQFHFFMQQHVLSHVFVGIKATN